MAFSEDLTAFFADFGELATWGAYTAKVLVDSPTEDLLGGRVLSTDFKLTLPAAELPGIAKDGQVVIGSATYQVREVRLVGDGKVKELMVRKL